MILNGFDVFDGVLPGPGLTGGFNLDAGFVKQGPDVRHFAVFADHGLRWEHLKAP